MKCGLGNWKDVAEQYVKGGKTPDDCEEHFFTFYSRSLHEHIPNDEDFIIMQRFTQSTASQLGRVSSPSQDFDNSEHFLLDESK